MAKNVLKAWLVDNTVTTDDKTDKIFSLETTRSTSHTIYIGEAPEDSGSTEKPGGSDGDSDDSPMD